MLVLCCSLTAIQIGVMVLSPDGATNALLFAQVQSLAQRMWWVIPVVLGVGAGALGIAFGDGVRLRRIALLTAAGLMLFSTGIGSAAMVPVLTGGAPSRAVWAARGLVMLSFHGALIAWAAGVLASEGRASHAPMGVSWALVVGAVVPAAALVLAAIERVAYPASSGGSLEELVWAGVLSGSELLIAFLVFAVISWFGAGMRSVYLWPALVLGAPACLGLLFAGLGSNVDDRIVDMLWMVFLGVHFGAFAGALVVEGWRGLRPAADDAPAEALSRVTPAAKTGDDMALWDGRFSGGPADDMVQFGQSLDVDMRMWREDLEGSRAHVRMLGQVGLLDATEVQTILDGLDAVGAELESGAYRPGPELEDVHMAVESRLIEIVGPVGAKLHTARSRNDQVATDVRLWLRTRLNLLRAQLVDLVAALLDRIEADGDVLIPGFTHLQRGQPILLGHHLLAYAWMVRRDAERVTDALKRNDACPLGAGAMAGTPHPIDRELSARYLDFSAPVPNAMDAVAARDHLCEAASTCAIAMSHMSRQAEELVLWSTAEFRLIRIGEAYTTGSSIMPQKRNPDAAELVRGKTGRVYGDLQALLTMVKGLPLAYNRDLQEDRQALFDAIDTTTACARMLAGQWRDMTVRRDRYESALEGDFLLATELADWLVTKGIPFREAHHVSGRIVAWCEGEGVDFRALDVARLQSFHPAFDETALTWLSPRSAAERRTSLGGTAPPQIALQLKDLRRWCDPAA